MLLRTNKKMWGHFIATIFVLVNLSFTSALANKEQCSIVFSQKQSRIQKLKVFKNRPVLRKKVQDTYLKAYEAYREVYYKLFFPFGEHLADYNPNAYYSEVMNLLDNKEVLENNPEAILRGYNKKHEANLQSWSEKNSNTHVHSWYKNYENADKNTYRTINTIAGRKRGERPKEWVEAIKQYKRYVKNLRSFPLRIAKDVRAGFEAEETSTILLHILNTHKKLDFTDPAKGILGKGLPVVLPFYRLNEKTLEITREYKEVYLWTHTEVYSRYKNARSKVTQVFGIKPSPYHIFRDTLFSTKPVNWAKVYNVFMWPVHIPITILSYGYSLLKSTGHVTLSFFPWVTSIFKRDGGSFKKKMVEQAQDRRRVEMFLHAIMSRSSLFEIPLNPEEIEIFNDSIAVLRNPNLAPPSFAVKKAMAKEIKGEKWTSWGFQIHNIEDTALPAQKYRDESKADRLHSVSHLMRHKVWGFLKQYGPAGVISMAVATTAATQLDNIKNYIVDTPRVSYVLEAAEDKSSQVTSKYFGYDVLMRDLVEGSHRLVLLLNESTQELTNRLAGSYRQEYRMDQSNVFIQNQEYIQFLKDSQKRLLIAREEDGGSMEAKFGNDFMMSWSTPDRVLDHFQEQLSLKYPENSEQIKNLRDHLTSQLNENINSLNFEYNFSKEKAIEAFKSIEPGLPEQLKKDMQFFIYIGFQRTVDYYINYGNVDNSEGTRYLHFKAPIDFNTVDAETIISYTPYKDLNEKHFKAPGPINVLVLGEPNSQGLVEVKLLGVDVIESPTGQFFVPLEAL